MIDESYLSSRIFSKGSGKRFALITQKMNMHLKRIVTGFQFGKALCKLAVLKMTNLSFASNLVICPSYRTANEELLFLLVFIDGSRNKKHLKWQYCFK